MFHCTSNQSIQLALSISCSTYCYSSLPRVNSPCRPLHVFPSMLYWDIPTPWQWPSCTCTPDILCPAKLPPLTHPPSLLHPFLCPDYLAQGTDTLDMIHHWPIFSQLSLEQGTPMEPGQWRLYLWSLIVPGGGCDGVEGRVGIGHVCQGVGDCRTSCHPRSCPGRGSLVY